MNNELTLPMKLTLEFSPSGDPQDSVDMEFDYLATKEDWNDCHRQKFSDDDDATKKALSDIGWRQVYEQPGAKFSDELMAEFKAWLQTCQFEITGNEAKRVVG